MRRSGTALGALAAFAVAAGCTFTVGGPADMGAPRDAAQALPDATAPPDLGGLLAVSLTTPVTRVDLSSEGALDWAHWGLFNELNATRKAGVPSLIGDFALIGPDQVSHQYTDNGVTFLWSDGTPTVASDGTNTGIFVPGAGNGFRLTVAADQTVRTLRLYLSSYAADFQVTAEMSDGSAVPFTDRILNSAHASVYKAYTFVFRAKTPDQKLSVTWVDLADHWGGANVTLQAATLH